MPDFNAASRCLLTGLALFLNACAAGDRPDERVVQAVEIGGSSIEDACSGSGIIREDLDQVTVRAAPTSKAEPLDQLPGGTTVWFCDDAPDWIGVVYDAEGRESCGVGSPASQKTAYAGPCKTGWIERTDVTLLAG